VKKFEEKKANIIVHRLNTKTDFREVATSPKCHGECGAVNQGVSRCTACEYFNDGSGKKSKATLDMLKVTASR